MKTFTKLIASTSAAAVAAVGAVTIPAYAQPLVAADPQPPVAADAPAPAEAPAEAPDSGPAASEGAAASTGADPAIPALPQTPENTPGTSAPAPEAALEPTAISQGVFVGTIFEQITGVEPFNDNDLAGYDSNGTNDIVRTNDLMTYRLALRTGNHPAPDTVWTLTLPSGEAAQRLPAFCGSGSTIEPPSLPNPATNLTADSYKALPSQTISCHLGDIPPASSLVFSLSSKVRPEVPNGTTLTATSRLTTPSFGASQVSTELGELSHRVSAKAMFDITVGLSTLENTAPIYNNTGYKCTFDGVQQPCQQVVLSTHLLTTAGGKGNSPFMGDVTYDIVMDTAKVFSSASHDVTEKDAWKQAENPQDFFRLIFQNIRPNNRDRAPFPAIVEPDRPQERSVTNSGTTTLSRIDPTTRTITATIKGMDSSAWLYPTQLGSGRPFPLPDKAAVYEHGFALNVPSRFVKDLGSHVEKTSTWNLPVTFRVQNLQGKDLAGNPIDQSSDDPTNNYRTWEYVLKEGQYWDVRPMARPDQSVRADSTMNYLAAQSAAAGGDGTVVPGQDAFWNIFAETQSDKGYSSQYCLSFDNTYAALSGYRWAGDSRAGTLGRNPNNGKPAWGNYTRGIAPKNIQFQYGAGAAGPGEKSLCRDQDAIGGWFDNPADVPGNDPELAKSGIFTAANKVRVLATGFEPEFSTAMSYNVQFRFLGHAPEGTAIGMWASGNPLSKVTDWKGYHEAQSTTVATATSYTPTVRSTYDPGKTSAESQSGSLGGRVITATANPRILKEFVNRTGQWTPGPEDFVAGSTVNFRLKPSLYAPVPLTMETAHVKIEDCAPAGTNFVHRSANIEPTRVTKDPEGLKGETIDCADGETRILWDLPAARLTDGKLEDITYQLRINDNARNGGLVNTAAIWVNGDRTPKDLRTAKANLAVNSPAGIRIAEDTPAPVIELNHPGTDPIPAQWDIEFINLDSPQQVSDVDVLAVLPRNRLGATKYNDEGSIALQSLAITAGDKIEMFITAQEGIDPDGDPKKITSWIPYNKASAEQIAAATAVRLKRDGAFNPENELRVRVTMVPQNNREGDIYSTAVKGFAEGLRQPVGPVTVDVEVIGSALGNLVWEDRNANGRQDEDEPGLEGIKVVAEGLPSRGGKQIRLETTTDSNGRYFFPELVSGEYTLTFSQPRSGVWTTQHAKGTNEGNDSDVNEQGVAQVTLAKGEKNLHIDAGLITGPAPWLPSTGGVGVLGGIMVGLVIAGLAVAAAYGATRRRASLD